MSVTFTVTSSVLICLCLTLRARPWLTVIAGLLIVIVTLVVGLLSVIVSVPWLTVRDLMRVAPRPLAVTPFASVLALLAKLRPLGRWTLTLSSPGALEPALSLAQLRLAVSDSAQGLVRGGRLADHNRDAGGRERRVLSIDRAEVGLGADAVVDQSPGREGCQCRVDRRRNAGRGCQQLPRGA